MILASAIKYEVEATGEEVILCGARHGDIFVQTDKLGISQSYISRLEKKIIDKLKIEMNKKLTIVAKK